MEPSRPHRQETVGNKVLHYAELQEVKTGTSPGHQLPQRHSTILPVLVKPQRPNMVGKHHESTRGWVLSDSVQIDPKMWMHHWGLPIFLHHLSSSVQESWATLLRGRYGNEHGAKMCFCLRRLGRTPGCGAGPNPRSVPGWLGPSHHTPQRPGF